MPTAWKKITKPLDRKVLVTNNRKAKDAFGQMSHVWLVERVYAGRKYGFSGYNGGNLITAITHYSEIPK